VIDRYKMEGGAGDWQLMWRVIDRYKMEGGADDDTELRRSSVHLLLSMLCLPLQFGQTPIRGNVTSRTLQQHIQPPCTTWNLRHNGAIFTNRSVRCFLRNCSN